MDSLKKIIENRIQTHLPNITLRDNWFTVNFCEFEIVEYYGDVVKDYTATIQRALDLHDSVYIPYSENVIYISKAIILNTGNRLKVHPDTRIVLVGDSLMLRNRNMIDGHLKKISPNEYSDSDIYISGGIWEAPDTQKNWYGGKRDFYGCDSLLMMSNVRNVCIEDITFRNSNRMAIQIGNCSSFVVQNICLENVERDGVHVEGPAKFGLIKNIRGKAGDDHVALNAWDWTLYSLTFGTISDIIIEDIFCEKSYLWSEIRLLSGVKFFEDGEITDCSIFNIVFNNIHNVHTFKMYFQPEPPDMPTENRIACSNANSFERMLCGQMYNVFFDSIDMNYFPVSTYHSPKKAAFEIYTDIDGIFLRDISFDYPLKTDEFDNYSLIAVGKMNKMAPGTACHVGNAFVNNISDTNGNVYEQEKLIHIRDAYSEVTAFHID